jgi:hypothetical protein
MDSYYGDDGTLYVWTGSGYQAIPKVAASDYGTWEKPIYGSYSSGDGESWGQIGSETGYGIKSLPGLLNPYDQRDSNNFMWTRGDENSATYQLKSADKEGTQVTFQRDGDYYMPLLGAPGEWDRTTVNWDTNPSKRNIAALAMATIAAGGALAAGAGAGGGAGQSLTSYGVLDASAALPGTTITPAALSAPGTMTTYGVLDTSLAAPGTTFTSGNTSLLGSLGQQAGNYLTDPKNLSTIVKAGGLLSGMVGGANSGDNTTAGGPRSVAPSTIPQMYGGSQQGLLGGWGQMGPTETERRMRQNYLPSLLGSGPWGY